MSLRKSLLVASGLAVALAASSAQADIVVTLSENGTTVGSGSSTTGNFNSPFTIDGYNFTFETNATNQPGVNGAGVLSSTLILAPTYNSAGTTLPSLTVDVQETNPFAGNSSPTLYTLVNSANGTSGSTTPITFAGDSIVNGSTQGSVNFAFANNGMASMAGAFISSSGYTLEQKYTLSGVTTTTGSLTVGFTTTVSPAVVPEPSSLVLTGLVSIGVGGYAIRRRVLGRQG